MKKGITWGVIGFVAGCVALILELALLRSDVHFLWKPVHNSINTEKIATVHAVYKFAKARSPTQLQWFDLKSGQELFEGDSVATIGNSKITLEFVNGQVITLGANSLLVLQKTTLSENPSYEIVLVQGSLKQEETQNRQNISSSSISSPNSLKLAKANAALDIQIGNKRVRLGNSSHLTIESQGSGAPVIIGEGSAQDLTANKDISIFLPQNSQLSSIGQKTSELLLSIPLLNEVSKGERKLKAKQTAQLSWKITDQLKLPLLIEIATDHSFSKLALKKRLSSDSSNFEFYPDQAGEYFWRISRVTEKYTAVSQIGLFNVMDEVTIPTLKRPKITLVTKPQVAPNSSNPEEANSTAKKALAPPQLKRPVIQYLTNKVSPLQIEPLRGLPKWQRRLLRWLDPFPEAFAEDNPQAETRFQVDLDWDSVPHAVSYQLQIAADSSFKYKIFETKISDNKYTWRTNVAGFYFWRVAAIDENGDSGQFSEFMTFLIKPERNIVGDESTYESFIPFDEYSKTRHTLKLAWGPNVTNYNFSSSDPGSPSSVTVRKQTFLSEEIHYSYRVSPHLSADILLRDDRFILKASDFENRPNQPTLIQDEAVVGLGLERRFFEPRYYYFVRVGFRMSYVELPILGDNPDILYPDILYNDTFGFFGLSATGGISAKLGRHFSTAFMLGFIYQFTGNSTRLSNVIGIEIKRNLNERFNIGFAINEFISSYKINEISLTGHAHAVSFRPMIFLESKF